MNHKGFTLTIYVGMVALQRQKMLLLVTRKWRLALHGHLDSTHYHREPEELGIPTLGEDGGLYVLPEHSAIRMDPDQMKTDLVHYATNLATLVDVLKQGDRRHVLSGIPPHVRRVLEEEFGGGECKD